MQPSKLSIYCFIFYLVVLPLLPLAQSNTSQPINHYDLTTSNDTLLLNAFCSLQLDYSEANRDSSIFYGYKALFKKIHDSLCTIGL